MVRVVPPMTRRWFEALPPPYQTDKQVIAMRLPRDWTVFESETKDDKYRVLAALSPDKEQVRGLQMIDVKLPLYIDQREMFQQYKVRMADPSWVGPLSNLPQWLLLDETAQVLLFVRDEMWKAPINLHRLWKPAGMKC